MNRRKIALILVVFCIVALAAGSVVWASNRNRHESNGLTQRAHLARGPISMISVGSSIWIAYSFGSASGGGLIVIYGDGLDHPTAVIDLKDKYPVSMFREGTLVWVQCVGSSGTFPGGDIESFSVTTDKAEHELRGFGYGAVTAWGNDIVVVGNRKLEVWNSLGKRVRTIRVEALPSDSNEITVGGSDAYISSFDRFSNAGQMIDVNLVTGRTNWTERVSSGPTMFDVLHGRVYVGIGASVATFRVLNRYHGAILTTVRTGRAAPLNFVGSAGSNVLIGVRNYVLIYTGSGRLIQSIRLQHTYAPMGGVIVGSTLWTYGGSDSLSGLPDVVVAPLRSM